MYFAAYSPTALTLVSLYAGTPDEKTFPRALEAAERLAADSTRRGALARWVTIVDPEAPPPSSAERKQMALTNAKFGPLHVALVTPSMVQRAVITAVHWLQPLRPGQRYAAFGAVEEAIAWHEELARARLPVLRELVLQVQASTRGAAR
ncbi:MAG TPA: hypothetical protein VFS43_32655 [Polyangiaceae bacterium]|nr:hypothetical protein [Polyangiaceae bacterium]